MSRNSISIVLKNILVRSGRREMNPMAMQAWILRGIHRVAGVGFLILAVLSIGTIGPAGAQNAATTTKLTAPQLEQLVAPIALHPDALLSQILMASTYPLEVIAAARWSQANPNVTGDALQSAMQQQPWDPSVKALTALPQTLQMMSDKLEWTQQLGDAFLAQQSDVLNAVQQLRARANANGQLKSTPEQKVTTTPRSTAQRSSTAHGVEAAPANVYAIESTNPDEYYVPIYDPGVVYGTWPYTDYQPDYWYPPGYVAGNVFSFATGVLVGSAIWGNINWRNNFVQINPLRYNNFNRTNIANIGNGNWAHNPAHRGAVPYRDAGVAQRFGQQGQSASREAFRGKTNAGRGELGKLGAAGAAGVAAGKLGQKGAGGSKAGAAKTAAGNKAGAGKKGGGAAKTAANKKGGGAAKTAANKKGGGAAKTAANRNAGAAKQARSTQGARGAHQQAARSNVSRSAGARAGGGRTAGMGGGGGRSMGGGGARGGGGGRGGGGRRSDIRLKHDIVLLGRLDNGIGFYRFSYNGSHKAYVGVMAQEVQAVMPQAVARDRDGYLEVFYDKLGLTFQTYDHWMATGAHVPALGGTER
jgi:hypothetical protein